MRALLVAPELAEAQVDRWRTRRDWAPACAGATVCGTSCSPRRGGSAQDADARPRIGSTAG